MARGLTSPGIVWAFSHVYASNWHPLTWISHMIDCEFYGSNPRGHHLTNVLLHGASSITLFLVLWRMTNALWRSAFVATFFAIHPLRAESVAWIAERKDVLSGFFFMLTIAAYVRYVRRQSRGSYLLVTLSLIAGLLCKPMLVTLPVVLLLLDYWPLERFQVGKKKSAVLEKIPWFICVGAIAIATVFAQQGAMVRATQVPWLIRIGNAITSCLTYVRQTFWPSNLAAFYPFPPNGISIPALIISSLFVLGISAAVFLLRRRKYLVTGWLWYLVMLAPVIGIVQVGEQSHADRYTYLPQIGLCLAVVWGFSDLCSRWRHASIALGSIAAIIVAALTLAARAQVQHWQNSESLWRHALAVTPDNPVVRRNLGETFQQKGNFAEAVANYYRALAFDPDQVLAHTNIGAIFLQLERPGEAVEHFETALKLQPKYTEAESNLGFALSELGRLDEAVFHLQKAIANNPDFADAHYNLANTFLDLGRLAESIAEYKKAIELNPRDERALNNLAWILSTSPQNEIRDGGKAVEYATRANDLTKNQSPVINATLAAGYAESGRFPEAIETSTRAIDLAAAQGNNALAGSIRNQRESYGNGQPFRDERKSATTR